MTTRDDLPKPVEATFPSVLRSLRSLQVMFKKMGFGMQSDHLQGAILALQVLQKKQEAKGAEPVFLAADLTEDDSVAEGANDPTG